jgi:hypothetical protein
MKSRLLPLCLAALLAGAGGLTVADDGAITNKSMSRTIQLPDFGQEIVNNHVPEAEHVFTDLINFYVPAQAANGVLTPIAYCDIDNTPEPGEDCVNPVETLEVAKPLINVFIYGPLFEVEHTAFGHSFMDAYAAVSLDDGETWKQTNLSESADLSSFNLDEDHIPSDQDPLPNDHNILLGQGNNAAYHANGYETPFTSECTECHGSGLQGTAQTPSCFSCHGQEWEEDPSLELGPVVYKAEANVNNNKLEIDGYNALPDVNVIVTIINAVNGDVIGTAKAEDDGKFELEIRLPEGLPCVVAAQYTDEKNFVVKGPGISVVDKQTGEPIEECLGSPVDLVEYPGGVFNIFHASAGNKVLVAWPSRFCSQGQPAYSMTTETGSADPVQQARLLAITDFIRDGNTDLAIEGLPEFTSPIDADLNDDLYLTDAFGVQGSQGSIDFADEGYPQAGVVPFGCVWTSRGILLPGDDPRTEEVVEGSHMVWTKAERLTSGRRDPNRIEVKAVKNAGFVITWQEDPDGLRPGQGEGPGEGWSGAVAHPQTDVWYSFINWEYFDLVEQLAEDGSLLADPINVIDHDLLDSGRPQVFVPMAIPMRLTNNAKCQPPATETPGGGEPPIYCNFELAEIFGLDDQCADTVIIDTGSPSNPQETAICVADSMLEDGVADLPNRANTASTRPRLALNSWGDETDTSAWVVVAAEESKGLGKFFFEPDGLLTGDFDGYADPCAEDSSITCTEEIGKNAWYFSFDMGTPDTSAGIDQPNSLVENLVAQGNLLNQPEVYWETGEFYGLMSTQEVGEFLGDPEGIYGDYDFDIVSTEIARRTSLLAQSIKKACDSENHLIAMPLWKQGPMRQGGPADVMGRRMVAVCEDRCDDSNPGPGPGGAQPSITEAVYLNTSNCYTDANGVELCELVVEGFVCVDGAVDPTQIVISIEDAATGEDICEAKVDEGYDFTTQFELPSGVTAACMVPVEEVPCDVVAVVGPGQTGGDGQASEPAEVVDEEGEPVCDETLCPIQVDAAVPSIDFARYVLLEDGTGRITLRVDGLDGDLSTAVQTNNAVTGEMIVQRTYPGETTENFVYRIAVGPGTTRPVPCAVQVADVDADGLQFGPWEAVAGAPADCAGPIPPECSQ